MRILVTGANGFVGHRLVGRLLAEGHEIVAACGPLGRHDDLPAGVTRVALDLADRASVEACARTPCDAVMHLAGLALASEANRSADLAWRVNAQGTADLFQHLAGRTSPLPRVLFTSSAEVYAPATRPHVETDAVAPTNPYGASKLAAELAGRLAWGGRGLPVVVARSFPHSGPGQDPRFWIPKRAALLTEAKRQGWAAVPVGDLSAVRDFLHVDDVIEAYVRLLVQGVPGEVYNVAAGVAVTLDDVHTRLEQLLGVTLKREYDASQTRRDARPYLVGDPTKLRTATGWKPCRSMDDMLQAVLDAQAN